MTSMVLIGIQPFAFKKIFILVLVLLCLSSALCFADSLFMTLHSKPWGRQLNRIKPILPSVSECVVQPPSPVACPRLDGRFAQDSGWIVPEAFVF
jgi:hypothetical protein